MRKIILACFLLATPAKAELLHGWWLVSQQGSDSNNCFQATQVPNESLPACKTFTHVCDMISSNPTAFNQLYVRILAKEETNPYVENVHCVATGTAAAPLIILGHGPSTFIHGKDPTKPVWEMDGSTCPSGHTCGYINWGKYEFANNTVGGSVPVVLMHDETSVDFYYNTTVSFNKNTVPAVEFLRCTDCVIREDDVANNDGGGVLFQDSPNGTLYKNSIYYSPTPGPLPGTIANNSPGLCFEEQQKTVGYAPTITLINSPNSAILSNGPITKSIDSASQAGTIVSDTQTDIGACTPSP